MKKLVLDCVRCFREGAPVFPPVTLTINARQAFLCEGANGSGKTTLLRALMGLCSYEGKVLRDQETVASLQGYASHLSVQGGLREDLTVREHIRFWMLYWPASKEVLEDHLARLHLTRFENRPVRTLSSGERQRLKFLPLLLQMNPLWLLDEPFTHLDEEGCLVFESLMERHLLEGGMALLTKPSETRFGLIFVPWHRDLLRMAS